MPTNVAARMTLAADPGSLQGAVAAGILGCGPVILGTSEACARLLEEAQAAGGGRRRARGGGRRRSRARSTPPAAGCRGSAIRSTGRSTRAPSGSSSSRTPAAVSGPHVLLARRFRDAVAEAWGKPLTMNVSMPIAAVMLDLGFPSAAVKAVPILARTAGLLAHLAEEQRAAARLPDGGRGGGGDRVRAPAGGRARLMLAPEVETRPWAEQLAVDDASYRDPARLPLRALGLLPREARGGRVRVRPRRRAGSRTSRSCRSPRSARSGRPARPRTRSARTSARRRPRSSGSTRRAAPPARPATSR